MGFWDFFKNLFAPKAGSLHDMQGTVSPPDAPQVTFFDDASPKAKKRKGLEAWQFDAQRILALSAQEWRKRALKIQPWRTPWIGRRDVIPPLSDESTALIDRGLVLSGRLTEEDIREIHEVGDLWLEHHEQKNLIKLRVAKSADALIAQEREERKRRREEKREAAEEGRRARAAAIEDRKRNDIVYLGRGVSKGLADRRSNIEKLNTLGLPLLATPADVASFLGLPISKLRWLAFHSDCAERTHYISFEVPKRAGGVRRLSAPHTELRKVQRIILDQILAKVDPGPNAHGFVKKRSTVTHARLHLESATVIHLDIQDFFPTVDWRRVRGLFRSLGYSPAVATVFALLTTESPRVPIEHLGKRYEVAVAERALPQGAPTSPALSNLIARRLDRRLAGFAKKKGWRYSRYADDLTFSLCVPGLDRGGNGDRIESEARDGMERRSEVALIIRQVCSILEAEGFVPHPKKRRIQRKGRRQRVTGIVVNQKLSVPREEVRRLRAILHAAKATGLEAQNREGRPNFAAWLRGRIAYVGMVDADKGRRFRQALDEIEAASKDFSTLR